MKQKQVTKLFAVALAGAMSVPGLAAADAPTTLASGAPACGNVQGKGGGGRARQACQAARQVEEARSALAAARAEEQAALAALVSQPRTLATGAPACGNVLTKAAPPPCTAERADALYEERVARLTRAAAEVTRASQALREATARHDRDAIRA